MTKQKMTETNKSKSDSSKLQTLINLLESKPELVDLLIDSVVKEGATKKKPEWRGRHLILFPNGEYKYLTPAEMNAKEIVDNLIKKKKLSTVPSETALNRFFQSGPIRTLNKADRFFAKQYYKQYYLDWSEKKK